MTKLNQIIAIEKSVKNDAFATLTNAHHLVQKAGPLSGISRVYQPKDEDGDVLPPESTPVQLRTSTVIKSVENSLTRLFDLTLTKDAANAVAAADIIVDGNVLIPEVPVTTLLFLEKQLTDLYTFVKKLPVLDAAETWHYSETHDAYATDVTRTVRTKKVPRNHVKAEATEKHPAQVELFHEDVLVGTWSTIKFSGALPVREVTDMLSRVVKLQEAVKFAREEANGTLVTDHTMGERIFKFIRTGS